MPTVYKPEVVVQVPFTDMLDRPIESGDYFAFPTGAGRSQTMNIFQLISATVTKTTRTWTNLYGQGSRDSYDYKIKAQKVLSVWDDNCTDRPSNLVNGQNALKLKRDTIVEYLRRKDLGDAEAS